MTRLPARTFHDPVQHDNINTVHAPRYYRTLGPPRLAFARTLRIAKAYHGGPVLNLASLLLNLTAALRLYNCLAKCRPEKPGPAPQAKRLTGLRFVRQSASHGNPRLHVRSLTPAGSAWYSAHGVLSTPYHCAATPARNTTRPSLPLRYRAVNTPTPRSLAFAHSAATQRCTSAGTGISVVLRHSGRRLD